MAGFNFGNKNSTCKYSNQDIAGGYGAAVGTAVLVASALRKLTQPMSTGAHGKKLLLINTFVAAGASACASVVNTKFMRKAEANKGIQVFSDV